jgi:hypothetical protein
MIYETASGSRKTIRLEFILCVKLSNEELQEVCFRETLNQRCSGRASLAFTF